MKCPFKKETTYKISLAGTTLSTEEDFMDCIEEECAAYTKYRESKTIPSNGINAKFEIKYFYSERCNLLNRTFKYEEAKDE